MGRATQPLYFTIAEARNILLTTLENWDNIPEAHAPGSARWNAFTQLETSLSGAIDACRQLMEGVDVV